MKVDVVVFSSGGGGFVDFVDAMANSGGSG